MFLGATDHLGEGMFEDPEKFVGHFRLAPEKCLQALDPLEIGNDHTAGITQNIWNHENFVPALLQN